jgi:hypothetical protein
MKFAGRVPRPSPTGVGSYKKSHPLDAFQNQEKSPTGLGSGGAFLSLMRCKPLTGLASYKSKFQTSICKNEPGYGDMRPKAPECGSSFGLAALLIRHCEV